MTSDDGTRPTAPADEDPDEDDPAEDELRPVHRTGLLVELGWLLDEMRLDTLELDERPVTLRARGDSLLGELPPWTWTRDHGWRLRLAQAAADLLADLEAGDAPRPRCVGEEVMLLAALHRLAETWVDLRRDDPSLPAEDPGDWLDVADLLMEDTDAEAILGWDGPRDIYRDAGRPVTEFGGAEEHHPDRWWDPFGSRPPRDPLRERVQLPER